MSAEPKSQAEEAAGDGTDDEDLERGGQIDQTTGKVEQDVDDAVDAVKHPVRHD